MAKGPISSQQLLLAEYTALRDEIMKRMEWQHQILGIALSVASAVASFGTSFQLLLFPVFVLFLAILWVHYDYRVRQIGVFIREHIETPVLGPQAGWETFVNTAAQGRLGSLERLSARGILIGAQLVIMALALGHTRWSLEDSTLFVVDLLVITLTLLALRVPQIRVTSVTKHASQANNTQPILHRHNI